jgi:hypothetical protein
VAGACQTPASAFLVTKFSDTFFGIRLKNAKWEYYIWQLSIAHCKRHIPVFPWGQCFCVLDLNLEPHQILLLAKSWQYTSSMALFGADRNFQWKQSFKFMNGQFTRGPSSLHKYLYCEMCHTLTLQKLNRSCERCLMSLKELGSLNPDRLPWEWHKLGTLAVCPEGIWVQDQSNARTAGAVFSYGSLLLLFMRGILHLIYSQIFWVTCS